MDEKFMREKPVLPLLAAMAAPMALSMLVNSLYNIVDSFFVAQISQDAMTALSLVFPVQNFVTAVAVGFGVGMGATISFYLGAGQSQRANAAASRGFLLSALHGLVLTAAASLLTPFFLAMFTTEQQVLALGATYGRIVFAFSTVVTLGLSFEKLFQAVGSMKVAMVSLLCGCIANILLDPVLIFGWGPFPALGIAGAAWASCNRPGANAAALSCFLP